MLTEMALAAALVSLGLPNEARRVVCTSRDRMKKELQTY